MSSKTAILGISCFYHNSAAALVIDGIVVAAAEEERFSRKKNDSDFPAQAIAFCLAEANLEVHDLAYIVFYEKPLIKFERLLRTYIRTWPLGLRSFVKAMSAWTKQKLWAERIIRTKLGFAGELLFVEHHYAHAASAYYCSPFDHAAVITMDGVGEWDTTTIGKADGNRLQLQASIQFPHSLGLLYSAITHFLGFKVNSDEYKVMGLAPYGDPEKYSNAFRALLDCKEDGSFALAMEYFSYEHGLKMTGRALEKLFGIPARVPGSALAQAHKDIAAALQKALNGVVLRIAAHAQKQYGEENLVLAGGVALNAAANGCLAKSLLFKEIYIQPAAGDAGGAVGAALYVYYELLKHEKNGSAMPSVYLGPAYDAAHIEQALGRERAAGKIRYVQLSDAELFQTVAALLEGENAVGWFQGKMEFGPRALGNRSILADPRNKDNWQKINRKIKFRENFRPFAPSVLAEHASRYFSPAVHSPNMLFILDVLSGDIPAVTHVDRSARVQTIAPEENARFYSLIEAFYQRTGVPLLINTSFNVAEEPIVCSPEDALSCFLKTNLDYLVLGSILVSKEP